MSVVVRMSIPQLFQPFFQPLVQLHLIGFLPPSDSCSFLVRIDDCSAQEQGRPDA